jgi:hypothetical protein
VPCCCNSPSKQIQVAHKQHSDRMPAGTVCCCLATHVLRQSTCSTRPLTLAMGDMRPHMCCRTQAPLCQHLAATPADTPCRPAHGRAAAAPVRLELAGLHQRPVGPARRQREQITVTATVKMVHSPASEPHLSKQFTDCNRLSSLACQHRESCSICCATHASPRGQPAAHLQVYVQVCLLRSKLQQLLPVICICNQFPHVIGRHGADDCSHSDAVPVPNALSCNE